jgi:uncharacterized membrane protein HdeD (DUF308 family)
MKVGRELSTQPAGADRSSALRSPYWGVPVARAIPALIVGLVLTFMPNHSSQIGLFAFGAFSLVSGVLIATLSFRVMPKSTGRSFFILQGVVMVVAGALALLLNTFPLAFLLYLVSVSSAITAMLEIYSGIRARGSNPAAKDWIVVGAATGILALVFLLLPLTAVVAVGIFGAYGIMLGIFLLIAGLSLRWGTTNNSTKLVENK